MPSTRLAQGGRDAAGRLPAATVGAFALSAVVVGALGTPLTVYLPNFYASELGMKIGAVGMVFLAVKLLDIVFDPLMGMAMDRTRTRLGRYRFWMVLSSPPLMLGAYMTFMARPGVGAGYLGLWLAVMYVGYSLVVLSQSAWGAVLARGYNERSRVYAWAQVAGVCGAVVVLLLPTLIAALKLGDSAAGVRAMGWFVIVSTPITAAIVCLFTPEPLPPALSKADRVGLRDYLLLMRRPAMIRLIICDFCLSFGPGFTAPLYLFFFHVSRGYTGPQTNTLLLIYIVGGLVSAPIWARLSYRFGKHKTLMAATVLYAIAQTGLMLVPKQTFPLMAVGMFTVGFVATSFVFLVRSMVADVGDTIRLDTGKDRTGMLYAFVTSTLKIGSALAVGVTFTILAKIGFDARPGAVNTPDAIRGLEACYVAVPVVMALVGGLALIGWKLDAKRHGEVREALAVRDNALAAEEAAIATASGGASLPGRSVPYPT